MNSITSDKDYLEIVDDGLVTISTTGGGDADADPFALSSGSVTITHSLGEVPIVRGYIDTAKNGRYYSASGRTSASPGIDPWLTISNTTTTTKLIINSFSSQTNIPVFYRIYRFGDKSVTSGERIDKIFTRGTHNATLSAAAFSSSPTTSTVTLPHGQGEVVLHSLMFSENQTTWYNAGHELTGAPDTTSGPPGGPYSYYYYTTAYASTDSTNLYITYEHNYATSKTIYVRYYLDYKA